MKNTENKTVKAWDLKLETSFFPFVTQDLSMLESLLVFILALVLGMLELILLSSLLAQILSMLGPAALLALAQV